MPILLNRPGRAKALPHAVAALLAAGGWAPVAVAETGATAQIDEMVVTARRREESLQDVPVSVSAISGAALENRGFTSLTDIQKSTPNLSFTSGQGGNSGGVSAFIRGVGESEFLLTSDPAVALYMDGVYVARSYGASTQLLDIDRVEVLRGPQGSLFGKNTIGGAISVTTRRPDGSRDLQVDARIGSYGLRQIRASGQTPLTDQLYLGLSAMDKESDGWQKLASGGHQGNEDVQAARAALRWQGEKLDAVLSVDGLHQRQNGTPHSMIAFSPSLFSDFYSSFVRPCCTPDADLDHTDASREQSRDDADVIGTSLTVDFAALGGDIKSITGFRRVNAHFGRDGDGMAAFNYAGEAHDDYARQWSQEVQYLRNLFDDTVTMLLGVYAFSETATDRTRLYTAEGIYPFLAAMDPMLATALDFNIDFDNRQETTNYAVFGNVTIALSEAMSLDLGGRYTYEEKEFEQAAHRVFANAPLLAGYPSYKLDDDWSAFTPKAVLSYRFNPEVMGYFSLSQGFRSGGFNGRPTSAPEIGSYDPEKLTSAELGLKTELFDRRLRLNSDIYYNRYRDMQLMVSSLGEGGIPFVRTENAGKSEMYGFETEATAVFNEYVSMDAAVGYLKAQYLDYESQGQDLSDLAIKQAPRWSASLGLTLTVPVTTGVDARLRIDGAFKDDIYIDAQNSPYLRAPAHTLWNASLSFDFTESGLEFILSGENLSDKRVLNAGFDGMSSFGFVEGYYNPPRRWYATLRYRM